jgi:thiamine biosynthesis protein ThiI
MRNVVVVHYHEIGLKGRNRSMFEKALGTNLKDATRGLGRESVERLPGRVIVRTPEPPSSDLLDAVGRTFGVAAYAPAVEIAADMNVMASTALELLSGRTFETFAIAARRATKELPFTSRDINVRLGDVVREATGTRVDLSHPGVTVHVDVVGKKALMYADRFRGPGGLPVGVSGHVMSLLSGGIDSPVATWRMMRRGARVSLCHFHSYPFTDKASVR